MVSVATAVSEWRLAMTAAAWSLADCKRFARRDDAPLIVWLAEGVLARAHDACPADARAGIARLIEWRAAFDRDPATCGPRPLLNGRDVLGLGHRGPIVRQILRAVSTAQLNETIATPQAALDLVSREFPVAPPDS